MRCPTCNGEYRYGTKQVGVDGDGVPIYHRFAYCDYCRKKRDLDIDYYPNERYRGNPTRPHNTGLSIWAFVLVILVPFAFIGVVLAVIDLIKNSHDGNKHAFSYIALVLGVLILFGSGSTLENIAKRNTSQSSYTKVTSANKDTGNSSKSYKTSSKKEMTENEFKGLCVEYTADDYNKILRNPDQYNDYYAKLNGRVKQVIEGLFGYYTIYIEDSAGNIWETSYSYKDGEPHLLEGDNITIWGNLKGTTTSSTVLGKQVIMPDIDVKYYTIN